MWNAAELQFQLHEAIESGRLGEVEDVLAVGGSSALLKSEPLLHEAVATDDLQVRHFMSPARLLQTELHQAFTLATADRHSAAGRRSADQSEGSQRADTIAQRAKPWSSGAAAARRSGCTSARQ